MHRFRIPGIFAFLVLSSAAIAESSPPQLSLPLDCEIGNTCYIQKYVNHGDGDGYRDYRCGPLSSGEHDGTDIRLIDVAAMEQGVAVIASATGTVLQIRDGMPDVNVRLVGKNAVTDQGLGNRVVIDHGNNWLTIYGHMRRGSIAVRKGDRVEAGQKLGQVGMSGLSEFPHVHFAVWHNRNPVDPFVGPGGHESCNADDGNALWTPAVLKQMAYVPSFVMHSGFATRPMARIALQYGLYHQKTLPRKHRRLYFGVFMAGLYAGDTYAITLHNEKGHLVQQKSGKISRLRSIQFFMLRHETESPLPPGRYDASFTLTGERNGTPGTVLQESRSVTLR